MTWGRVLQIIGLIMVGIWLTYTIVAFAALAGTEAAEPGPVVVTPHPMPGPTWVTPR